MAGIIALVNGMTKGIAASQAQSTGELWSWTLKNGRETAQLWGTVYLAVQPPQR